MKTCGIYAIRNKITSKSYVGRSVFVQRRWSKHQRLLGSGNHFNDHLQSAWNKYGSEAFELIILEEIGREELALREAHWQKQLNTNDREFGYNKKVEDGRGGWSFSAETIEKLRRSHIGKKHSEETIRRCSAASKARVTPESRLAGSIMMRKRFADGWSPSIRRGHKLTEAHREAIRLANLGKKHQRRPGRSLVKLIWGTRGQKNLKESRVRRQGGANIPRRLKPR